jgi:hypothetical protein
VKGWNKRCLNNKDKRCLNNKDIDTKHCEAEKEYNQKRMHMQTKLCFHKKEVTLFHKLSGQEIFIPLTHQGEK